MNQGSEEITLDLSAFFDDPGSTKDLSNKKPGNAEEVDSRGCTPLLFATAEGQKWERRETEETMSQGSEEITLDVSTFLGDTELTNDLSTKEPGNAKVVDSRGYTPLHYAAAEGHKEIVKELLKANKDGCLQADEAGRIPLHLAAMRGRVEVIKELIKEKPESILVKMHGYTVFHLCVMFNHLDALQLLLESKDIDDKFINSKGPNNETILLTSARLKQSETACYLVSHPRVSVDSKSFAKAFGFENSQYNDQYEKRRGYLMVVASLIAQMSFQVVINPPGGFWPVDTNQSDDGCPEGSGICKAGTSILAYTGKTNYHIYTVCSTLSFVASLSVILLLISQVPLPKKYFVWLLIILMWTSILLIGATYIFSIRMVHVHNDDLVSNLFSYAPTFLPALIIFLFTFLIFYYVICPKVIPKNYKFLSSHVKIPTNLKSKVPNKLKNFKSYVCCQQKPTGTVVV